MGLDVETGFELIKQFYKQRAEEYKQKADEMLWQRWLVDYARMDEKTFVGFEEYKKKLTAGASTNKSKPTKTKQQIIGDSEKIIEAWKKGGSSK